MVAPALLALALGTLGAIADIPKPWLNSSDIAVAGASFWVRCSLPQNAFSNIQVRSVAQNHLGKPLTGTCRNSAWYTPPKLCWFRVPEDEEGALNVSCEAELKPYSSQMEWKEIRVEAKPRLEPGSCPAQQNWIEGETQILDCWARGSPDPDLECTKDGISFPVRTPLRAQRIHAGIYLCRAWNYLGSVERNVTVWVQNIPKLWLNSSDTAVAGASFWVRCSLPQNAFNNIQVRSVAQNHLGKPLTGTCQDSAWYTPPKLCWFRVPEDEEGALNVSCEAELKPYSSQMEWKEIRVEAKPRLEPGSCPAQQNWIEGETQILDCRARGSPDPYLECTKDRIALPVRTPLRAQRIHAGIYLCRAWNYLGSVERNVTVWVQNIPKPWLNSSDTAVAGASFWVRCSLPQNAFNNIRVRLVAQNHLGWPLNGTCSDWELYTPPKLCWYRVPQDEEGALNVSCEAELKPYSSQMEWKEIRVEAKPRLEPGSCPAQQNWIEGETQILDCRARGSPDPDLECTKDGISFPVRTPIRAERIHTGIYLCRAWNYLGSTDRNVTVLVQNSAPDSASSSLLPVVLGILLAVVALLVLTGLYWWHHHSTEDDKDWHRARRSRPPRHQGATVATKGVS